MSNVFIPIASETFFLNSLITSFLAVVVIGLVGLVIWSLEKPKMTIVFGTLCGVACAALLTVAIVGSVNFSNFKNWAIAQHEVWDISELQDVSGFMTGETPAYSKALDKVIYIVNEDGGLVLYSKDVSGEGKKLPSAN